MMVSAPLERFDDAVEDAVHRRDHSGRNEDESKRAVPWGAQQVVSRRSGDGVGTAWLVVFTAVTWFLWSVLGVSAGPRSRSHQGN